MENIGHEKENRKFLGDGGVIQDPSGTEIPRGWGGLFIGRTIRGKGMDIFWNHTLFATLMIGENLLTPPRHPFKVEFTFIALTALL